MPEDLFRLLHSPTERPGRLGVLVGGEPLLDPAVARYLAVIRAAGCVPGLITTGRPLLYPQVRERLRKQGLAYLQVRLFGARARHDERCRTPGGYDQVGEALRMWLGEDAGTCDVDVALVSSADSTSGVLQELEEVRADFGALPLQILLSASAMTEGMEPEIWSSLAPGGPDAFWHGSLASSEIASVVGVTPLGRSFCGPRPEATCLGRGGSEDLAPSDGPDRFEANSFNYVRTDVLIDSVSEPESCAACHHAREKDPCRQLWLPEEDRLRLFETDTGDFDRAAVARVKDRYSHVFLDRSGAGILDDFREGMRRVRPDPFCDPCRHREACGRRFLPIEGPPFAREEAWISGYVASLRGQVLDVGCGEQLYRDVLGPLVAEGVVRYTGIDPDLPGLQILREAIPGGRFLVGGIEELDFAAESFDRVLCLRSLNHVFDVDEAMARMAECLRPGGELLIVETTPFAMLRSREQVEAADRAPRAGHQHLRNLFGEQVLPYARRRRLEVLHHSPASLETSNEWILLLRKPEQHSHRPGRGPE